MINNAVVDVKMSSPENPYKKLLTPDDKLRLRQDDDTSIMKSIAYNIKHKRYEGSWG